MIDIDIKELNSSIENSNEDVISNVIRVEISKIKENPENFYDINYEIDLLVESIKEVGLLEPLIVDCNYIIISGHRRLNALRILKSTKVDVRIKTASKNIDIIEANRYRKKDKETLKKEISFLKDYYEKMKLEGTKPRGRISELIAEHVGVSPNTVKKNLNNLDENKVVIDRELSGKLCDILNLKSTIKHYNYCGTMVIKFNNYNDFDQLCKKIGFDSDYDV